MKKWFANMKIRKKMFTVFTCVNILFGITSIISVVMLVMARSTYNKCIRMQFNLTAEELRAFEAPVRQSISKSVLIIIILFLVSLAISICIAFAMSRSMAKVARDLEIAAKNMSEGDVDIELGTYGKDEFGSLAESMKILVENTRGQAQIAGQLARGNLDLKVTPHSEKDLMGNAFAKVVEEENRVMSGISEATLEIKTGSQQVAAASQSLAQGSTEQASAIQQITASINDITERTRVNAEDATKANGMVIEAKNNATEGNSKMKEMIEAMSDINTSSENISKIIKVIDDIAFQTNILALNAAVEAARAGAHGRGFAVVADEVRNLAGKSAQAASETAELIEDSINKVSKGSKLAEETAAALEAIVKVIDEIVSITDSIAVASNDQATAIGQIDQAINQVSQVVQTNSATSEQCAAASEELSAQAGKLREMIGRYKLRAVQMKTAASAEAPEAAFTAQSIVLPEDEEEPEEEEAPVINLDDDGFGKY